MYSKTYQLSFNVYCKKHMSLTVIHPSLRDVSAPDDLHIQNLTRSVFHLQGIQKERIHHLSLCLILIVSQSALKLLHCTDKTKESLTFFSLYWPHPSFTPTLSSCGQYKWFNIIHCSISIYMCYCMILYGLS